MAARRLHFVPLLAGIAVAVLTLQLGNWQIRRADEKAVLQAEYASPERSAPHPLGTQPPAEWQVVDLRGQWLADRTILIDNRVHAGRAGFHVFTPLRLAGRGGWVLVNRGWVAAPADRAQRPAVTTPGGEVEISGRVRHPESKPFTLEGEAATEPGIVWQALDLARYRVWSSIPVADFYVQQNDPAPDSLVRDWPAPDAGIDRHRGYAFQWYAMAALAAALTLCYVWQSADIRLWRLHGRRDSR
ncbi:MAG TPA: SURF1 family protein [Aromatoleum sp.]|uniref:SURF1 family protein n=1 Tax=Aromatoleum sp. TaxID=2307007 RepID=UPI002B4A29D9|nr:SURF1 family protein [Aromatoleum sp.]HJV24498.1 SURF1 family protein [Aromatoleum sp.]